MGSLRAWSVGLMVRGLVSLLRGDDRPRGEFVGLEILSDWQQISNLHLLCAPA